MRTHGGISEICQSHQAPAGFVKQATGEVTTTKDIRARWEREKAFIARKKQEGKWGKHFERIAVGSQTEEIELHRRKFDGSDAWHRNRDALDYLRRAGHPIATENPALLSRDD